MACAAVTVRLDATLVAVVAIDVVSAPVAGRSGTAGVAKRTDGKASAYELGDLAKVVKSSA